MGGIDEHFGRCCACLDTAAGRGSVGWRSRSDGAVTWLRAAVGCIASPSPNVLLPLLYIRKNWFAGCECVSKRKKRVH